MEEVGGDPKLAAMAVGTPGSDHKLPGFGIPLAAEALRNLGYDLAKPDRHVNRAIGVFGMVEFSRWEDRSGTKAPEATPQEMLQCMAAVEEWAAGVGVPTSFLDNALWLLCAKMGLYLDNAALGTLVVSR